MLWVPWQMQDTMEGNYNNNQKLKSHLDSSFPHHPRLSHQQILLTLLPKYVPFCPALSRAKPSSQYKPSPSLTEQLQLFLSGFFTVTSRPPTTHRHVTACMIYSQFEPDTFTSHQWFPIMPYLVLSSPAWSIPHLPLWPVLALLSPSLTKL